MRIIGKSPRLFCIDGVDLVPGSQIIIGEREEKLKKSKYFAEMVSVGNFVIDEIGPHTIEDAKKELSAADKIAIIKETLTDDELDKLAEGEKRKGVLSAIKEQRAALREGREDTGEGA